MTLTEHELVVLRAIHDWSAFGAAYLRLPGGVIEGIVHRLRDDDLIRWQNGSYVATEKGLRYVHPPKNVVRVKTRRVGCL
jgi:hypothetical protein